jgi:hypothetical protein
VDSSKPAGAVTNAVLLIGLVFLAPFAVILLGLPVVLLVRLAIEVAGRLL